MVDSLPVPHKAVLVDCGLWTMNYGLSTMDYRLSTIDYRLWTIDYRLWTMDYGLSTMDYLPVCNAMLLTLCHQMSEKIFWHSP